LPAEDMKFLPDGKQVLAVTAPPAAAPPVPLGSPPAAAPRGVAGAPPLPANTQVQRDTSAADFEEVGDAEMKQGRHSEAAEAYQRAIGAGASGGTTWRKLGVARKHLGDSAGASEALGKSKAKGDALASCELGDLHESNGDSASAITEFTACLGGKPQNATDIRGRLDRLKGGN
jgi:tetratricopeptide (TPR) repeat protein